MSRRHDDRPAWLHEANRKAGLRVLCEFGALCLICLWLSYSFLWSN